MYTLLCTSYNVIEDENTITKTSLILRNNWSEEIFTDTELIDFCDKFEIDTDFKYPSKGTVSPILIGKMEIDNVELHIRIVRF